MTFIKTKEPGTVMRRKLARIHKEDIGAHEALMRKYPAIFRQRTLGPGESCMSWGLDCGKGWLKLIDELCDSLQFMASINLYPRVEATQVKEKLGRLCFYYRILDDPTEPKDRTKLGRSYEYECGYIAGLIAAAEHRSHEICEDCGKPGVLSVTATGWRRTVCPRHAKAKGYKPLKPYDWRRMLNRKEGKDAKV